MKESGKLLEIFACAVKIRKASGITFVTLRHSKYFYQGVYIPDVCATSISELCEGAYIKAAVCVKEEKRAPHGFELTIKDFDILSKPSEDYPISISQPIASATLEERISNRTVSIRHPYENAIFIIRSVIENAFSDFMQSLDFINIRTPKIIDKNTAADTGYISVRYFDKDATLTSSPALYKIMSMAGFDRVYECGAGYSGVNKNSLRHLNEYTRLDFQMAYGTSVDAQELIKSFISYLTDRLNTNAKDALSSLDAKLPGCDNIMSLTFDAAMEITQKHNQYDLDPSDEARLCDYAKKSSGSDYIIITDFPDNKRPFYEKDGSGFCLLSGGIEIASGGESISSYNEQIEKIAKRGLCEECFASFLSSHKGGLPPSCGVGFGLERLMMSLLKLSNIREATLFTRDLHHITP